MSQRVSGPDAEAPAWDSQDLLAARRACVPPQELFIYYLRGAADDRVLRRRGDFLGNWREAGCSFLFFDRPAKEAVRELLRAQPGLDLIEEHRVAYSDWLGGEIATYTEGSIRVVPVWESSVPESGVLDVRIDPGVVFGAGNHPTTRACLRALQRILAEHTVETVLDLGSGTGLLGIAAARLGACRVLGVDSNPLAAETTRKNIMQNGQQDRALAACGLAESLALGRADLVLANIHYEVMRVVARGSDIIHAGSAVLTGVFPLQAEEIASILQGRGMRVVVEAGLEEAWPLIRARGTGNSCGWA
jgi:ribosomal protein L11 methyltransferase